LREQRLTRRLAALDRLEDGATRHQNSLPLGRIGFARNFLTRRLDALHRLSARPVPDAKLLDPQAIRVVVDGDLVGTVKPSGSEYTAYNVPVRLSAGKHVITLIGTDAPGNNMVFIDSVHLGIDISETPSRRSRNR
jgi:hypothetical protein